QRAGPLGDRHRLPGVQEPARVGRGHPDAALGAGHVAVGVDAEASAGAVADVLDRDEEPDAAGLERGAEVAALDRAADVDAVGPFGQLAAAVPTGHRRVGLALERELADRLVSIAAELREREHGCPRSRTTGGDEKAGRSRSKQIYFPLAYWAARRT